MFKDKKAVIFDMDGTLIDSIGMWNDIDREIIIRNGALPRPNIGGEREKFLAENSTGDIYLNYSKYLMESYNLPITPEEIEELRIEISRNYLQNIICFKPGVVNLLQQLKANNFILILATNSSRWVIDIYINENENINHLLSNAFTENILTKDDVTLKKPDPEIYLKAIDLSGVEPHQCLVIEDSLSGVIAAKKAGLDVCCIYDEYANNDRHKIIEIADYNIDNYHELIAILEAEISNEKEKELTYGNVEL